MWWRLSVRSFANDAKSQPEPISEFVNNVRERDIRYTKDGVANQLWFTAAMEPFVAAKYPRRRCLRRATANYIVESATHHTEQFQFIALHRWQSQLVFVESFVVGQYAWLRYTATASVIVACGHTIEFAEQSAQQLRYTAVTYKERDSTWATIGIVVGHGDVG